MNAPTPGPWKWVKRQTRDSKTIELIHPQNGYLLVMDFVRLGMQSGTFRLATWKGDERSNMGGIMRPAHEIDMENHPDARLIARAPEMADELARILKWLDTEAELIQETGTGSTAGEVIGQAIRVKALLCKDNGEAK